MGHHAAHPACMSTSCPACLPSAPSSIPAGQCQTLASLLDKPASHRSRPLSTGVQPLGQDTLEACVSHGEASSVNSAEQRLSLSQCNPMQIQGAVHFASQHTRAFYRAIAVRKSCFEEVQALKSWAA